MWAACKRTGTWSSQSLSKRQGFPPGDELPTRGADEGSKSRVMGEVVTPEGSLGHEDGMTGREERTDEPP